MMILSMTAGGYLLYDGQKSQHIMAGNCQVWSEWKKFEEGWTYTGHQMLTPQADTEDRVYLPSQAHALLMPHQPATIHPSPERMPITPDLLRGKVEEKEVAAPEVEKVEIIEEMPVLEDSEGQLSLVW